jgi:cytoskeletal protein CcmA (bactofilin family)
MSDHSQVLVISAEHTIIGTHRGTVRVTSGGTLCLDGTLQGTLDIQTGATVRITGQQQGTVAVAPRASVTVSGAIQGTTSLEPGASLVIEPSGKLAGTLVNYGLVIVRGVFGGAQSGNGTIRLEGDGYIKQPTSVKDGAHYYEW